MRAKISFLMTGGLYVSEDMCELLWQTALDMYRECVERRTFRSPQGEGVVRTIWKTVRLGCISGVEFSAQVEAGTHTSNVRYIVRTRDLEDLDLEIGIRGIPEEVLFPPQAMN